MKTYRYRAIFEPGETPEAIVVTFPDVPEVITDGEGREDAFAMGADALGLALLYYIKLGRALPDATEGEGVFIAVEPDVAAKLAVLEVFSRSGLTKTELARRLGKDEKEIRRILDPLHPTKITPLQSALAAMGHRLVVGLEAAE